MNKIVAGGLLLVVLAELMTFVVARRWTLPVAGVAVALLAWELRGRFAGVGSGESGDQGVDDSLESLHRWRSQTQAMVRWADSSRADWDRHLRPKLAREFVLATRQRDASALAATGQMVFGAELWQWVDPQNVAATKGREPGPGRDTLDEILRRMEQL
ncbi:MAG: hypothetical protein ACKOB8_04005 [Mycobacterium sp.]